MSHWNWSWHFFLHKYQNKINLVNAEKMKMEMASGVQKPQKVSFQYPSSFQRSQTIDFLRISKPLSSLKYNLKWISSVPQTEPRLKEASHIFHYEIEFIQYSQLMWVLALEIILMKISIKNKTLASLLLVQSWNLSDSIIHVSRIQGVDSLDR